MAVYDLHSIEALLGGMICVARGNYPNTVTALPHMSDTYDWTDASVEVIAGSVNVKILNRMTDDYDHFRSNKPVNSVNDWQPIFQSNVTRETLSYSGYDGSQYDNIDPGLQTVLLGLLTTFDNTPGEAFRFDDLPPGGAEWPIQHVALVEIGCWCFSKLQTEGGTITDQNPIGVQEAPYPLIPTWIVSTQFLYIFPSKGVRTQGHNWARVESIATTELDPEQIEQLNELAELLARTASHNRRVLTHNLSKTYVFEQGVELTLPDVDGSIENAFDRLALAVQALSMRHTLIQSWADARTVVLEGNIVIGGTL